MLTMDLQRCEGCGICVEVCPEGALYLVEGKATVDTARCDECESLPPGSEAACVAVCPAEAIAVISEAAPAAAEPVLPLVAIPEPTVVRIETQQESVALRTKLSPVIGAVVAWAGREMLPRLADTLLLRLERWAAQSQTNSLSHIPSGETSAVRSETGKGRRHRYRRRGE